MIFNILQSKLNKLTEASHLKYIFKVISKLPKVILMCETQFFGGGVVNLIQIYLTLIQNLRRVEGIIILDSLSVGGQFFLLTIGKRKQSSYTLNAGCGLPDGRGSFQQSCQILLF